MSHQDILSQLSQVCSSIPTARPLNVVTMFTITASHGVTDIIIHKVNPGQMIPGLLFELESTRCSRLSSWDGGCIWSSGGGTSGIRGQWVIRQMWRLCCTSSFLYQPAGSLIWLMSPRWRVNSEKRTSLLPWVVCQLWGCAIYSTEAVVLAGWGRVANPNGWIQ